MHKSIIDNRPIYIWAILLLTTAFFVYEFLEFFKFFPYPIKTIIVYIIGYLLVAFFWATLFMKKKISLWTLHVATIYQIFVTQIKILFYGFGFSSWSFLNSRTLLLVFAWFFFFIYVNTYFSRNKYEQDRDKERKKGLFGMSRLLFYSILLGGIILLVGLSLLFTLFLNSTSGCHGLDCLGNALLLLTLLINIFIAVVVLTVVYEIKNIGNEKYWYMPLLFVIAIYLLLIVVL